MRTLDAFVELSRHETMTIVQVVQGIRTADIPWLRPSNETSRSFSECDTKGRQVPSAQVLLHLFMVWVFNRVVVSLLANAFYVTEAEGKGGDVFYFRKHVWRRIVRDHIPALQQNFVAVSASSQSMSLLALFFGFTPHVCID